MIRVLVVEDSAVTREYLVYLLSESPSLEVIGTARDGLQAVEETARLKPDVILMDVHMPRMDGYEATRQIMELVPTPIVMISASSNRDEALKAFDALKAGALTVMDKPRGPDHPNQAETVRKLIETVTLMAEVKVVRRWPRRERPASPVQLPVQADRKIRLIAIGASTGGPQTIAEILAELPNDLGVPLVLVQHIATGFAAGLAEWLSLKTRLVVKLAQSGESVMPGSVYIAPESSQMGITKDGRIRLTKELPENGFCPSASYLFRSVAEAYGRSAIGILLTGMGTDGATGLQELCNVGGVTIAQNEESSVVFGMPGEAVRLGAAQYVFAPEQIAQMIRALAGKYDKR